MKRAGFTMIELIFVIVILGILAAVALPKFIGVSTQAKAGKCNAFIGTLSRTVGPAIWAEEVLKSGATDATILAGFTSVTLGDQITIPDECGTWAQYVNAIASDANNSTNQVTIGENVYQIGGSVPKTTVAPTWTWALIP